MEGLVLAALLPSVASLAVTVALPAVLSVTLKFCVPPTSAAFEGNPALLSEELMATESVALVTAFQLASTPLTVTLKAVPTVWAVGVPVLPLAVPGVALSPGTRSCSFVSAPALTGMAELVLAVIPG